MAEWTEELLRVRYLEPEVEEHQYLEYKSGGALAKGSGAKGEITKDVSAFANADGGVLIYGIAETDEEPSKPEGFEPVDGSVFTKEWLTQVVSSIQPRVAGVLVHPVDVSDPVGRVYVVEIPKSPTAHQAQDYRYHLRYNSITQQMRDGAIRDAMHRGTIPAAEPIFGVKRDKPAGGAAGHNRQWLQVAVRNIGPIAIQHLKLAFTFPDIDTMPLTVGVSGPQLGEVHAQNQQALKIRPSNNPSVSVRSGDPYERLIECRSTAVLFPEDTLEFTNMQFEFLTSSQIISNIAHSFPLDRFKWKLFADDMPPRSGVLLVDDLITYGPERLSQERAFLRPSS